MSNLLIHNVFIIQLNENKKWDNIQIKTSNANILYHINLLTLSSWNLIFD